ncbi:uncharacterized protein Dana_GF10702 [Drosophila ananassae]|uniref:Kazal-like domain-containing protein n=1 Tax=Drosophila ananassae TaxID=7217 RepID=B3M6H4_DROAN|nr:ataxin-2 homolog [Drosophila ananassae]EDV40823.1 uncharacterized protein Dana_GF10702 [Drosophila ananassae]
MSPVYKLTPLLVIFTFIIVVQCLGSENDPRSARLMQYLNEPHFGHNRHGPVPPAGLLQAARIRSRSDSLPLLSISPHKHPKDFALRSQQPATVQHIMRREQFGNYPLNDQHRRYQIDQNQPSRFAHIKDAPVLDVGKNQFPQYVSEQYLQNFKASPRFNGNVIMKDHKPVYAPIQQHAIPVQASQYLHYPKLFGQQGANFNIVPSQQTALQNPQFQQDPSSYAVHEESENQQKPLTNQAVNYRQAIPPVKESKEAQKYLHFMGTNEYFLPKRDPDYKKLDAEHDQQKQLNQYPLQHQHTPLQQQQPLLQHHHQHQPLQLQQPQQHLQPQQPQQHQLPLQHQHQSLHQNLHYKTASGPDNSVSSSYNEPIQVSDLFYQQDPAPANSAVVRGSYQAGQDVFVVKSDGNKAVKHVVSTPMSVQASTQTPPKSHHLTKSHKSYTPEPLRFEFTEQDAIRGSMKYTKSPQGNAYYYETVAQTPREPAKTPSPVLDVAKPIKEFSDDAEDSADTEIGKQPEAPQTPTVTSTATQDSAQDTESYCEKICANVYDENDEIICGSDGYMYTGETQLQCYSSCLNISVTIKSKGSCT